MRLSPLPKPSVRTVALVLVVTVAGPACAHPDSPGLAIQRLESDIVFQASAEAPKGPDVSNSSDSPVSADLAGSDVILEFPAQESGSIQTTPEKPRFSFRAATTCPDAALNEFPDEPTPLNVPLEPSPRLPRAGLYRWKKSGEVPGPPGPANIGPLGVSGFENRVISNVELLQTDADVVVGGNYVQRAGVTFRYQMVQPDIRTGDATLTTYVVKTNGQTREQDLPVEETGSGAVTAGEPERGVVIEKIESLDGSRNNTFEPQTGLLLLPLRVRPGEKFRSVAVDPRTGQTLTLDGEVKQQERIDACGDILEGWRVVSTLKSSTSNVPITYNYLIAPHFGAVLIEEHIERTEPGGIAKLTFSQGQKDPGPVQPQASG
jgi:hypothetical protein